MTRSAPTNMSAKELVDRFLAIALAQDEALLNDEYAKYNRLYEEMDLVKVELKSRKGDQRRLLLPLLQHPNAQVRLKAGIATLAIDRAAALATLQRISDQNEYPQAANARGMIEAVAEGSYKPS